MIRIAIAGFGKIGKLRYKTLIKFNNVHIVGILEKNKSTSVPVNITRFQNFDELLSNEIDAIFICAYNNVLAEYTIQALNKNIHVFCEKPPARNLNELKLVEHAFNSTNSILKYGFNHRYHFSVMEAKKLIESKKFGKILNVRGIYGKAGSIDYDKNWRNFKQISGGGILLDQGIHMLDLVRYLTDSEFEVKYSIIKTMFWKIEAEDNAFILMENSEGVVASIHSSATQWRHKFLLELAFENGYINLDGILSGTRSYAPEVLKYGLREFEDITMAMGKPQEHTIWYENDESWYLEIKEFLEAITKKEGIKNGKISDALNTLKLVEDCYKVNKR